MESAGHRTIHRGNNQVRARLGQREISSSSQVVYGAFAVLLLSLERFENVLHVEENPEAKRARII